MRCPIDSTPLVERTEGAIELGECSQCHGMWVPGRVTLALLKGDVEVPHVLAAASRPPVRGTIRVVCTDCNGRMRPSVVPAVMSCVRCGALWIASGNLDDLSEWHRESLQAGALALLQPTSIPYDPRTETGSSVRDRWVAGAVAGFALLILLTALPRVFASLRPWLLGIGGVALIASGVRFPSRSSPGALTRKGFAYAMVGVALVILALLDLR